VSSVYLVRRGTAAFLVDSGSPPDRDDLYAALAARGVYARDLGAVILTHGHADHAGCARWLQLSGAPIVLGAGDVALAAAGHDDPLHATSLSRRRLQPLFEFHYDPFAADVVVDTRSDLAPIGFPDAQVIAMPGHTAGSLVVRVGAHEALVGDMMMGGWFGGAAFAHDAGEHYYQADRAANYRNIARLLATA